MSYTDNTGAVQIIRQTARQAGVTLPDDLETALDQADRHTVPTTDTAALTDAVYQALTAGTDPADDPHVQATLTRHLLATTVPRGALAGRAATARRQALDTHADTIFERLQTAVADADRTIIEARNAVPQLDLNSPTQPQRLRPEQAAHWVRASDALLIVDRAIACWNALARLLNRTTVGRVYLPLQIADLNADQLDALLTTAKVDYRNVVAAGHPLSLATPDQLTDRIARVIEQREQQQHQRDNAYRAAAQRRFGHKTPA